MDSDRDVDRRRRLAKLQAIDSEPDLVGCELVRAGMTPAAAQAQVDAQTRRKADAGAELDRLTATALNTSAARAGYPVVFYASSSTATIEPPAPALLVQPRRRAPRGRRVNRRTRARPGRSSDEADPADPPLDARLQFRGRGVTARERADLADLVARARLEQTVECSRCGGHVTRDQLAKKGRGQRRSYCKGCDSDRVLDRYHRQRRAA